MADFTLSGLNAALPYNGPFAPSVGHAGQSFFKDASKAIKTSEIQCQTFFFLSCNNLIFNDTKLYGPRYNLVLNAIDGYASTIVAAIGVQSADNPELDLVMKHAGNKNISRMLNKKLSDVQPFVSIIHVGLPENSEVDGTTSAAVRLTPTTKIILSRLSSYISSMMLGQEHLIYKLAKNILFDFMQRTRRGTFGVSDAEAKDFELSLINRVNPFSKK
ncbi:hypothetical protein MOO45_08070 (plasmid) [Bombilactobacillus folatiphilus]|uniref:Uncharacterized protein n=1 Tax=Bombilactobacillus folatiphilus TaxID=2923362 RepID=A0ABY4PBP0_9LACO|nr:hypothetical protein [Bombilactobacillus folatiphilus]UQS81436.1 hypothetical protein MOO45_04195 [Bombilactobacillus folatiphilus]UQS82831.1 hypothetical protein MOO45_04100 [Bombilactobacillus folatiphilus]UQS82951.1 hypothetical protein MOO45_08070 [Bombilactobacillus folatiphilus]